MNTDQIRQLRDTNPDFPPLLHEIPAAPEKIYLRGASIGCEPKVAIVGTRKATATGLSTAASFARDLSAAGVTIVSGLAFGIDAAAHEATIRAGGRTIAVLGSGVDQVTPHSNEKLGRQILERGGTIVSEYEPSKLAQPHTFLERNRIISGLVLGVVVIEAPQRSGSLATARFAVEQNREVFVVPGSIANPNYVGSHAIIREGASLVTCAAQVLDALNLAPKKIHAQLLPFLDEPQQRIVELLSAKNKSLSIDLIANELEISTTIINEAIALLTIEGIVKEDGGAYYM